MQPGKCITAVKLLRAEEEYLKDHFPCFPVMPGVLMLEAMFQASAWLVRRTDDFSRAMVVLKEARNVKYADFVQPGQLLEVTGEIVKRGGRAVTMKVQGTVDGSVAVSARLIVETYNLVEDDPSRAPADAMMRKKMRLEFERLYQSSLEAVN